MAKQLIVTAHDFGLCKAVNDGIIYAVKHRNSLITEIALLPNAPGSNEAARLARSLDLSISLNVNFTTFRPLSSGVSTMTDADGNFKKVDIYTWDFSAIEEFSEEDIQREIDAQIDWFIKHVGKKPTALLSRKNEHGDPLILKPFVQKAKELDIAVRTPVWRWKENYGAQSYVLQEGVPTTDAIFLGLTGWKGQFAYDLETRIDELILKAEKYQGVSELVAYVGLVDEELFSLSSINWQRAQFLSLLDNDEFYRKIKNNFQLVSYSDLRPKIRKLQTIPLKDVHVQPTDADDISDFISIQKNDGFPHAYYLNKPRLQKLFKRGELFFIAQYKGKAVGFASVDCEVRAKIHFLCVDKKYAGNGIGGLLMQTLFTEIQKRGYHGAHTFVEKKSSKEIFLQKFHFQLAGVYRNRYGPEKDATIWEIELT